MAKEKDFDKGELQYLFRVIFKGKDRVYSAVKVVVLITVQNTVHIIVDTECPNGPFIGNRECGQ